MKNQTDVEFLREFLSDLRDSVYTSDEDAIRVQQIAERLEADPPPHDPCKTCKSWSDVNPWPNWRVCKHRLLRASPQGFKGGVMGDAKLGVCTHEDFGCIHHELKS